MNPYLQLASPSQSLYCSHLCNEYKEETGINFLPSKTKEVDFQSSSEGKNKLSHHQKSEI